MHSSLWWWTLFAGSLMACGFDGAGGGDGTSNPATCIDSRFKFAKSCGLSFTGERVLSSPINTSVDEQCDKVIPEVENSTPELCVIAAANITIPAGATVRATGSRPLVLAAEDEIEIFGTLDVASTRMTAANGESLGAGANSRDGLCATDFSRTPGSGQGGGGGGAGGSLGGRGGGGADGNIDGNNGSAWVFGGDTAFSDRTSFLRGGCRGQAGGAGRSGGAGGIGGPPGGAVFLAAGAAVQIVGRVNANGGGGGGGGPQGGGGGGGSGGFIAIEANMISSGGIITAKGGGGGEGGYYDSEEGTAYSGVAGDDPDPGSSNAANGGQSTREGGDGGAGSDGTYNAPGPLPTHSNNGGGGGGGGAGLVLAFSARTLVARGVVAPPFRPRSP